MSHRIMSRVFRSAASVYLLMVSGVGIVAAQSTPAPTTQPTVDVSAAQIEAALQAAEQDPESNGDVKKSIVELYRQALDELRQADQWRAKGAEFDAQRGQAPAETEKLKALESEAPDDAPPEKPNSENLDELKQRLALLEAELKTSREGQVDLEGQQRRRTTRFDEVRTLDEAARKRLEELYRQLGAAPATGGERNEAAEKAQRVLLLTRRANILAERASYAQELPSYEATRELLRMRLDIAIRTTNALDKQTAVWKEAVGRRMEVVAEEQARDARWKLITTRRELLPWAEENERLTQQRSAADGPAAKLKVVQRNVKETKQRLARLKSEFSHMRQVADLTGDLGQLLVKQRRQLPDVRVLGDSVRDRQQEIASTKLQLVDLEAQRSELADIDAQTLAVFAPLEEKLDDEERRKLEPAIRELLTARRGYLDALIADYNAYFNAMVLEQDKTERELMQTVRLYQTYIDERILWVASYPPQTGLTSADFTAATSQLVSPSNWLDVGSRLIADARAAPLVWFVALVTAVAFVLCLHRSRSRIAKLGTDAEQDVTVGIRPTIQALALTIVVASPAPAVLWFLGSRLSAQSNADGFVRALATAMFVTAPVWATIALVRQSLRRNGLAVAHLNMPSEIADRTRRLMWRLASIGIPATAIAAAMESFEVVAWQASLGRAAFVVGMACLLRAAQFALHPTKGILARLSDEDVDDFRHRLRRLWFIGGCLPPAVLIGLSLAGYHYAALQLAYRLQSTLWLVLGCVLVRGLLLRWLYVARRKLARQQMAQTSPTQLETTTDAARFAKLGTSIAASISTTSGIVAPPRRAVAGLSLKTIDIQSRRILNSFGALVLLMGTWWIWTDMLPALQFLDRWQLYSYAVTQAESVARTDGAAQVVEVVRLQWVTAADVTWAAIILFMTIVAGRNLPGLLEISCLRWLPIDQGVRYAVTTAARYVIHIAGVVAMCNAVGVQWSSVQWLAAAMTVGLGFGLQEIFANFISGLIILCERPIRVGDTVTIGDVTGTVNRIRGRATTIVDWDRKELIVPNKEFITGKLVNWTLTDDVLRTVIRIGVGHGSDVRLVGELLLQAARENTLVLADPSPSVAFTQVGEGRLEFELRVFSSGLEALTPLRHQLNTTILRTFDEAGLEIASGPKEMVLRTTQSLLAGLEDRTSFPLTEKKVA
ncbi:MAG: mechanosensitive ion channel [Planctomycetia bacterium]|nr:mechanosensitive ion channel [Planctomycetia bacterium]